MALPNIMVNDGTGTLRRAVATSDIQGTIEFQDNVNSTNAYVTTPDGEKHRVVLVANLGGSGGGSGSGDVTSVNGKTGAVTITGNDIKSTITGNGADLTDTVTNHLQTLKNDQEANGTQIHEIEAKIPQSATETNQLITKEDLPDSKAGTAGQVYTKTETGAEWKDAKGGGGDYLPLSGGIMTGPIRFSYSGSFLYEPRISNNSSDIQIGTSFKPDAFVFDLASTGILRPGGYSSDLGNKNYKWRRVYAIKLNNGADIEIPTTGGTMVVATPPTADGNYVLKATVSGGVVTTQWVAEA